jgi:hypothetical protein
MLLTVTEVAEPDVPVVDAATVVDPELEAAAERHIQSVMPYYQNREIRLTS